MVFGAIAAAIFVILVGWNIHHKDVKNVEVKTKQNIVLTKEVNQLEKNQVKTIKTFHGDELENLGANDVNDVK